MLLGFEIFMGMVGMFMAGGALIPLFMGGAFPVVLFAVGVGLTAAGCFYGNAYVNSSRVWKAVCLLLTVAIMTFAGLYWWDMLLNVAWNAATCCKLMFRMIFVALCI